MPTLVLDDGDALIESTIILDYLDELVGADKAMLPRSGVARRPRRLRICALACGLGDEAVSLLYERVLRKEQLALWVERCQAQIGDVLKVLEAEGAKVATPSRLGDRIGHADIASCLRHPLHSRGASRGSFDTAHYPALSAHAERCEALAPFRGDRAAAGAARRGKLSPRRAPSRMCGL